MHYKHYSAAKAFFFFSRSLKLRGEGKQNWASFLKTKGSVKGVQENYLEKFLTWQLQKSWENLHLKLSMKWKVRMGFVVWLKTHPLRTSCWPDWQAPCPMHSAETFLDTCLSSGRYLPSTGLESGVSGSVWLQATQSVSVRQGAEASFLHCSNIS